VYDYDHVESLITRLTEHNNNHHDRTIWIHRPEDVPGSLDRLEAETHESAGNTLATILLLSILLAFTFAFWAWVAVEVLA
jgi:hypothetical protein